jgi:hypothetical protein
MAFPTKYRIAEQVMMLYEGNPKAGSKVNINNIMLLVGQVANQVLKTEYLSVTLPSGDTVPPNCMIATYDNVPTAAYKTTLSKCTLPAMPISLPKNMGVFSISKTDDPNDPFIPIPSGLYGIAKPMDLLGSTSGLIAYEVFGNTVQFTRDLPGLGVTAVMIKLVIADLDSISIYDQLPITADMEAAIVKEVYQLLLSTPDFERVADGNSEK